MTASNNETFHIQTTEMGIPLHGIIRSEPAQHRSLMELDAPFSNVPPEQRLSAICKNWFSPNDVSDAGTLRFIFWTVIRIHQNPEAAAIVIKEFRRRRAALDDQLAALRQQKRQVIQEIKAEKGDCPEKHKEISIIANENGKLKQKLRKLAPECFREFFPEAIAAAYYNNFESYIAGPGQCPEHKKEVLQMAQLWADKAKTLQKAFARGWDLLIRQVKEDRYITKSDLSRQLEISAVETDEFISKVVAKCRQPCIPCLADVVVPDDSLRQKAMRGPVQLSKPIFAPFNSSQIAKLYLFDLENPFERSVRKSQVERFH